MVSTSYNFKTLLDIHHGHKLVAMVARLINTRNQKTIFKKWSRHLHFSRPYVKQITSQTQEADVNVNTLCYPMYFPWCRIQSYLFSRAVTNERSNLSSWHWVCVCAYGQKKNHLISLILKPKCVSGHLEQLWFLEYPSSFR